MLISIICIYLNLIILIQALNIPSGMWTVVDTGHCDTEVENVQIEFEIQQYKANRTHLATRGDVNASIDIDSTIMMLINACKHVDGGCKHYATIVGGMEELLFKHAKNNIESLLRSVGIDPPKFPIPKGRYIYEDFIMDYCELPTLASAYGTYEAETFFMKDQDNVGCLKVVLDYEQPEDEEGCQQ